MLMSQNMVIPFYLLYFHLLISALFFAKHSGTFLLHRHSLPAFYYMMMGLVTIKGFVA